MPIEYTWKIQNVKVLPNLSEKQNVVKSIEFMIEGVRNEHTHFVLGSVDITFDPESETFIPYEDLTETIVIEWVKAALGTERIDQYVNTIEQRFGSEQLVKAELPWKSVEYEEDFDIEEE